jgi:hypothetical protein
MTSDYARTPNYIDRAILPSVQNKVVKISLAVSVGEKRQQNTYGKPTLGVLLLTSFLTYDDFRYQEGFDATLFLMRDASRESMPRTASRY